MFPARTRSPQSRSAEEVAACNRFLEKLRGNPPREPLVATIKWAIADDCYENELKLNTAMDRLIDDISGIR